MLLKHSALYLLVRGLPGLVNFLAIAVFTRLHTPDDYERYVLVEAWTRVFNVVWLRPSLLRL